MTRNPYRIYSLPRRVGALIGAAALVAGFVNAQEIQKASTGTNLRDDSSWVGGVEPGSTDVGLFDSVAGPGSPYTVPGGNPTWGTIRITDPDHNIDIDTGTGTWTLAGDANDVVVDMSNATHDLTIFTTSVDVRNVRSGVSFGDHAHHTLATGRTFTIGSNVRLISQSSQNHILQGGGTLIINGTFGDAGSSRLGLQVENGTLGGTGTIAPRLVTSGIHFRVYDGSSIAPGDGGIGTLTVDGADSDSGFRLLTMDSGAHFQLELGAGGTFAAPGASDRLSFTNAAANDVEFNDNDIDFLGTGSIGEFKLFDANGVSDVWSGLTLSGQEITGGLNVTNLGPGMSGSLYLGDGGSFGDDGDIYLSVIPEPGTLVLMLTAVGTLYVVRRKR